MHKKTTITVTHLRIVHIYQGCLTGCRADAGHLAILCSNDVIKLEIGMQIRFSWEISIGINIFPRVPIIADFVQFMKNF